MKSIVSPVYSGQLTAHIQPFLTQVYSLNTNLFMFMEVVLHFYRTVVSFVFLYALLEVVLNFQRDRRMLFLYAFGSCTPFSKRPSYVISLCFWELYSNFIGLSFAFLHVLGVVLQFYRTVVCISLCSWSCTPIL